MGNIAKPKITIKLKDSTLRIKSENAFHSFEINCTLAEEWDEETADGRKCKVNTIFWRSTGLVGREYECKFHAKSVSSSMLQVTSFSIVRDATQLINGDYSSYCIPKLL